MNEDPVLDHYKRIYRHEARRYDLLVSREDYLGNLLPALDSICPLDGLRVVELGAGTGRLTRLLAPRAAFYLATDISPSMLQVARERLEKESLVNWRLVAADNGHLPIASQSAGLVLAGWSLGHAIGWFPESWPEVIEGVLSEMRRVLRPGGAIIILETLGTGRETPRPPAPGLAAYYELLEKGHGFQSTWIRTDYRFDSPAEAENLVRFFFGPDLAGQVARANSPIVPECTGIWWRLY